MTHGDGIAPDKGCPSGLQQASLDGVSPGGVGPVEHEDLFVEFPRSFQAIGESPGKGVHAGPRVLEIDDERIDFGEHLPGRNAGGAVEAENRYAENRVGQIPGFDHVVLFFRKKPMLR